MKHKSNDGVTKHQLATRYQISLRTVYRTLEIAGLSKHKTSYDRSEEFLFGLARFFLKVGYTRAQVPIAIEEFITQKQVFPYEQDRITESPQQ